MHVIVISLPTAQERRSFQKRQLDDLGLQHEILDAIGWQSVEEARGTLNTEQWERVLMPTELACFLSHQQVWQKIAQGQQPTLVLEDDVILSTRTRDFLNIAKELKGVDHISLETRLRHKLLGKRLKLNDKFNIARLYQDRTGAAAYILWPLGAKHLLQQANINGAALADAFIANDYSLLSYQSIPALAIQSDVSTLYNIKNSLSTHSYIQSQGDRRKFKATGFLKWKMKWRRLKSQLRLAARWASTLNRSTRQIIQPDTLGFDFLRR